MANNNPISINYSDEKLRILVEEYITQQRSTFTLKGVCDYVLYWAMEEGQISDSQDTLCGGNELQQGDQNRIIIALNSILKDGRIAHVAGYNSSFVMR